MRVLIIIDTSFVPYGGLSTVVMNYYRAINKENLLIDIASTNEAPESLINELETNNSHYYCLGKRGKILRYWRNLYSVLRNGYDVVHVNGNSATMMLELLPAKRKRIPIRIAHVHITKSNYPLLNKIIKPIFERTFNKAVAVSKDAGEWLFKNNYLILNNAIDTNKYAYSEEIRKRIRDQFGIKDATFVLGNIGKLNAQKNHKFLIKVFAEIYRQNNDSMLLIVGGGELEQELKTLVNSLGLQQHVIFTGMVDDACDYLQAMDFFAFPSKFEGLGLALIEAQSAGLECVISDKVPTEAVVTNNVKVIGVDNQYVEWADYILENKNYDRMENSRHAKDSIKSHGFDISVEAKKLKDIYMCELE